MSESEVVSRPVLSVVVPSYNTQDTIEETLRAIEAQSLEQSYEVIVVDCSEHDEVAQIASRFERVRVERRAERFNPGEGRNIGARIAQGQLLVFIDADVRLAPGSLAAAQRRHASGHRVFGGALELDTKASADLASYLEHYFFNHEAQASRPACPRSNLSSALMCFDRELFLGTGGFRDIPRMQDTELTERLRAGGEELFFFPDVLAYQVQDAPLRKVLRKIYINGQNVYYIRYQRGMTPLRRLAFIALTPAVAGAKALRIVARYLVFQPAAQKLRTLLIAPALFAGGAYWGAGLLHALTLGRGISSSR